MAWYVFRSGNDSDNIGAFWSRLSHMASRNNIGTVSKDIDPKIRCIALTDCLFFPDYLTLDAPADWSCTIVSGKTYYPENDFNQVLSTWIMGHPPKVDSVHDLHDITELAKGIVSVLMGDAYLTRGRIGQSGFRL